MGIAAESRSSNASSSESDQILHRSQLSNISSSVRARSESVRNDQKKSTSADILNKIDAKADEVL